MELPPIGAHCTLPSCNVLDFLPITCACQQTFCSDHIQPDRHECPAIAGNSHSSRFADQLTRCSLSACRNPGLPDGKCASCESVFCAEHRFADTHDCASLKTAQPEAKASTSTQRVKTAAFSTAKVRKNKPPKDPVKFAQWQKLELMKMRHKAVAGDPKDRTASVPMDGRVHVRVSYEKAEKVLWFRKHLVTGRVLDFVVAEFKVPSNQHQLLRLYKPSKEDDEDDILLDNSKPLAEQIDDGITINLLSTEPKDVE
ncbi:hypothetical protein BJ165DRAFT_607094 [Panaeolus papilionaceus]|nr:hypothetical protein BJ165DRAFT_607094 [Panaeolus papilionaceus]